MPSKDTFHSRRPEVNAWRRHQETEKAKRRGAVVAELARRLGKTPEEVVETIPDDTLRRLMYPVHEIEHEDGTVEYRGAREIREGVYSHIRR